MTPPCKVGDRVRLLAPLINPDSDWLPVESLPVGTEGIVDWLGEWTSELTKQIGVLWSGGRRLNLLPNDHFEVISSPS